MRGCPQAGSWRVAVAGAGALPGWALARGQRISQRSVFSVGPALEVGLLTCRANFCDF